MYPRVVCIALALLSSVVASPGKRQDNGQFCSAVKQAVTVSREQQIATSFCSSYLQLSLSTVATTKTVTSSRFVLTTTTRTVTTTIAPMSTTTTQVTVTTTSETHLDAAVTSTTTTTLVVATSTVFTTTQTSIDTSTVLDQTTTTSTSTATVPLSNCPPPTLTARDLGQRNAPPKPNAFAVHTQPTYISQACSCLSIPLPKATSTRTITVSTTSISIRSSTTTATRTRAITVTATSTTTVTETTTISGTQSITTTETLSSTATTSLATTTTSTTTSTSTQTSTATATVQRYSNVALLASFNGQYGVTRFYSSGHSGQGVYFSGNDLATAAAFSFAGTKLYYDGQYINDYQASSGNYWVVVDRPFAQFGYPMDCTIDVNGGENGCAVDCLIGGSGSFSAASGNDDINYGGAWGFQGSVDRFTVYAVGQTT